MNIRLSQIEMDVIRMLSEDKMAYEISKLLFRSRRTIEKIREKIKRKAGVRTIGGLMVWAYRNSLIE